MTTCAFVTVGVSLRSTALGEAKSVSSTTGRRNLVRSRLRAHVSVPRASAERPNAEELDQNDYSGIAQNFLFSLAGVYAALSVEPALAVPESLVQGFKSIPASLAHPATMWLLFATCGYAFYLGYQSRQIRSSEPEKRKELVKSRVTDRHHQTASALFAIMTVATFGGMANTFTRTGKLFPGPHLYIGLGLVATMSVMQAFVPYMQKGKDWARQAHFSLAFVALGFFGWQAKTGMDIVAKLLKW